MKSILLVIDTSFFGGAERMVMQLISGLSREFDVDLGFVRGANEASRHHSYDVPIRELRDVLFGSYDIIHTHLFLPGLVARLRRVWDARFRWVHTVHYQDYTAQSFPTLRRVLDQHFVFPRADSLVAVSVSVLETLAHHPNSVLVENAIDLSPYRHDFHSEERRSATLRPVLGTVAMHRAEKGLEDLIRAIGELVADYPEILLRVAGDGPLRAHLEQIISDLGLQRHIELVGFVKELNDFYAGLDVYVQPSRSESFGLAVLEAMRFGLPLVATDVGNLPRLLNDGGYGELVERSDEDGGYRIRLAETLKSVLESLPEHSTMSLAGRQYWVKRLSFDRMETAHRGIYEELLAPGICFISPIVTQSTGGIQRQIYLQSREMRRRGYSVFVLQRDDPIFREGPELRGRWSHARFLFTPDLASGRQGSVWERIRGVGFAFLGLFKILPIRHRLAVLHAHQLYSPTLLGVLAKLLLGKKLVVKVTASGELGERGQLHRLPFRRLRLLSFRFIDRVIVLSNQMKMEMVALGFQPDILELIPNSVSLPERPTHRPKSPKAPFRLLFCGRLSREKSLETLLEAGALLGSRGISVEIDLVGRSDPDRDATPALKEAAKRLEGRVPVRFHGYRSDIESFYLDADAFVLPSVSEGMSNALLEALSYGLVCVASDIPENRFLITHGENGLLFHQGSSVALADELERLVNDRANMGSGLMKQLSVAARTTVEERFSVAVVGARLQDLYSGLLSQSRVQRRTSSSNGGIEW